LRRNPTDAERGLWQALVNDRRFAGFGFKRQVPLGPHMAEFVSFPLKCVIELVPEGESDAARAVRADRHAWLVEHDYRVVETRAADVAQDVAKVLDEVAARVSFDPSP
jgi:tRNA/rRNA methyltransferase